MPRWKNDDRDDWIDDSGDEDDEVESLQGDDGEPTIACPYCRKQIHEDSQQCPYCERYVSEEDAPAGPKPLWIVIGIALCLYVVYRWIVGR
ncbi:MAG TPA: hypothetical protein VGY55_24190 [Pirellulales bacterium]|jgi:hypothetical protein|nr:hypothetical protein [Pirellulales bacterium]